MEQSMKNPSPVCAILATMVFHAICFARVLEIVLTMFVSVDSLVEEATSAMNPDVRVSCECYCAFHFYMVLFLISCCVCL